jgi:hypothetical protein
MASVFFNLKNCNNPPMLQGDNNFWCEVAKTIVIITSVTNFLDQRCPMLFNIVVMIGYNNEKELVSGNHFCLCIYIQLKT